MSLFRFGFKPLGGRTRTEADTNISDSTDAAGVSAVSSPATKTETASSTRFSIIPGIVSQPSNTLTLEPQKIVRDPAMPPAFSVDEEIKLGPVVMTVNRETKQSGRGFRKDWITTRSWMEYSSSADKVFCFPCRLFARHMSTSQTKGHEAFVSAGYDDWKHAIEKNRGFAQHETSELHQFCEESLSNRKKQLIDSESNPCIQTTLSEAFRERQRQRQKEILENRKYIAKLSNVMRFLMRLGLAVRGHRESKQSLHRGHFLEVINLLRQSDEFLDTQLAARPGNAHYLSPESQNHLIDAIGCEVLDVIGDSVRKADFFSVMMDETTDLAHQEQVAVVLRYCDEHFNAIERLISVTESPTVTGEHLAEVLLSSLKRLHLDSNKLCAQTYDGAASMSGCKRGVQAVIKETAPQAHYNHCRSHSCNLVIVKSVQCSRFGRNFFGVLEQLFTVIEGSAKRHSWFIDYQSAAGLRPKHLKGLSDTRWNCQGRSVAVIRGRLQAVNDTLERIRDESADRKIIGEVVGLLACTSKFEFAVGIEFFAKLLSPLDTLTTAIQGPDSTLHTVTTLSKAACQCLCELREDLDSIVSDAVKLATDSNLETEMPHRRPRKVSRRLDSCAEKTEVLLSSMDELKREMTEVVDMALSELNARFFGKGGQLYELAAMLMDSNTTSEQLRNLIENLYPEAVDSDIAASQFHVVRHLAAWTDATTLQQRALACPASLVELRKLYRIMITVPVTSAECERTFSKLSLIKNKLRTTCGQERLEKLLFCTVERDIVQQVDVERIVDRFDALVDNRRLALK